MREQIALMAATTWAQAKIQHVPHHDPAAFGRRAAEVYLAARETYSNAEDEAPAAAREASPQIALARSSAEMLLRVMVRGWFIGREHDEPEAALAYIALCLSTLRTHRLAHVFRREAHAPSLRWLADRSLVERARPLFPPRLLRIASRLAVRLGHIDHSQLAQASTWLPVR